MDPNTYAIEDRLPEDLPADPMPLLKRWFDEAAERRIQDNPNAMSLATVDPDGRPSVRIVLCKGFEVDPGAIVFYSNRMSRKGQALAATPRAAINFFWDPLGRQAIVEGPVAHVSEAESDAYFRSRPLESRIGAWSSDQSRPIGSRDALLAKTQEVMDRFGVRAGDESAKIPRPPHWGGYRIWAERVELWVSGPGRVHDRAAWSRELRKTSGAFEGGDWSRTRLQP